jgi:hypothetical protein
MTTELTYKEKIARAALEKIEHESLWIMAINKVLTDFSVEGFRLLIHSLNSQASDNPEVMKRILGPAYESVIACKSQINNHPELDVSEG